MIAERETARMQRRAWPIWAWHRARWAISDWRAAERFAWEVYTALRQMPRGFELKRLEKFQEGWLAEGVLPETGERYRAIDPHPYVAIRRMSLTAQFDRDAR